MGDLTLSQMQTRVLLALGDLATDDEIVSTGLHTEAINHAPNRLIRSKPDMFPEHINRSWTIGPTTVGLNRIALPTNLLILEKVVTNRSSTDPTSSWPSTQEHFVAPIDATVIGQQAKPSTVTGYPTTWDRKANDLIYNPTTRTGYTCYFRTYGVSGETALSGGGETFRIHRDWDTAVVFLAASEVAEYMGWQERAQELVAAVEKRTGISIATSVNVAGKERAAKPLRFNIAGTPR
jgi:hypothetical protein